MQATSWRQDINPMLSAFGKLVKSKRTELGLSQEELAERAGLHRTYVSDVERGIRNLTIGAAWFLAQGLELELKDMMANLETTVKENAQTQTEICAETNPVETCAEPCAEHQEEVKEETQEKQLVESLGLLHRAS